MASAFLGKRRLGVRIPGGLAGRAAARAELPPWTLHVLGTNEVPCPRPTPGWSPRRLPRSPRLRAAGRFGADLDLRLDRRFSLDLGASQGRLHVRSASTRARGSTTDPPGTRRCATSPLSALYHPSSSPERRVGFLLASSVGMAYATRVFAKSESGTAYGGKLGLDVRPADSPWLFTGVVSVLKSATSRCSPARRTPACPTGDVAAASAITGRGGGSLLPPRLAPPAEDRARVGHQVPDDVGGRLDVADLVRSLPVGRPMASRFPVVSGVGEGAEGRHGDSRRRKGRCRGRGGWCRSARRSGGGRRARPGGRSRRRSPRLRSTR